MTEAASVYGEALYSLAREEGLSQVILEQLKTLDSCFAQEKKKALNDAKDEISVIAMAIAGKVVGRELNADDQSKLVDSFIEELGE